MKQQIFLVVLALLPFLVKAQTSKIDPPQFHKNGVAINGYDPVAYFTKGEALKGDPQFLYQWNGVTWYFINKEHVQLFAKAPERYVPPYGGFCAYGASEKHKSPTNPNAWTIVGNKLFLNFNEKVKSLWIKDTAMRINQANAYWETL